MHTSKYSICVSNWNSVNTVRHWAASLLENLAEEDEVVIVDGQSTDGSQEFLREFCHANGFTFIAKKTNMGEARQVAFETAEGDYVIFCMDTDDIVVSLQEAKRLYREVVEWDLVTGQRRAFRCWGFFIIPREMLAAIGGYPDLHYYEDRLVAYRLAKRKQLTQSGFVSAVARGTDPKKHQLTFRFRYSLLRIRDGLRLGTFDARNVQGFVLLPAAWIASLPMAHYEFQENWESFDVNRDEFILPWIAREGFSRKLLLEEINQMRMPWSVA